MSLQANRRSRSERSEDARDIRRQGTLGAAPLIKPSPYRNEKSHRASDGSWSGDKEIRTPDFLLAKQALYQLSYTPEKYLRKKVVPRGVEPRTSTLSVWRSNQLS